MAAQNLEGVAGNLNGDKVDKVNVRGGVAAGAADNALGLTTPMGTV